VLLSFSAGTATFFVEKLRVEASRFKVRCDILLARVADSFNLRSPLGYQHLLIQQVNDRAQAEYEPAPYDGRILLFRPKGYFRRLDDPEFGWGTVARQGVQIVYLPTYPRGSLNQPFVEVLAKCLEEAIDETLSGSPVS
jgi:hypothetical protein